MQGYLHAGHLSLVRAARWALNGLYAALENEMLCRSSSSLWYCRERAEVVIVSIYVNPTQVRPAAWFTIVCNYDCEVSLRGTQLSDDILFLFAVLHQWGFWGVSQQVGTPSKSHGFLLRVFNPSGRQYRHFVCTLWISEADPNEAKIRHGYAISYGQL